MLPGDSLLFHPALAKEQAEFASIAEHLVWERPTNTGASGSAKRNGQVA